MKAVEPIYDRISFLERRYPLRHHAVRSVVGAVPLADIALILLSFMILNSWHVLKPALSIELPESPFVSGVAPGTHVVTVSSEHLIFYDDSRITMAGLEIGLARLVEEDPAATLVIQADHRVSHGVVVQIYTSAIDAGIREVALATRLVAPSEDVADTP